ncbi:MAG: DNA-binding protein [Deltaproteobacteria bacterium]|nr:DNA-binding protein [Deltaproteobacteria bacterium]
MPGKWVIDRARADAAAGKSPSVQAGEFVHEEMRHIREGEHGARSPKQAIAIGLSKARRSGVKLPPPPPERATPQIRKKAEQDLARAKSPRPRSARRSRAVARALRRETRRAASSGALSKQAKSAAKRRGPAQRRRAARKAVATKGTAGRRAAARKAADTRTRKG